MSRTKLSSSILAVSEWLLILPAIIFLAAASVRLLQPPQYEPARTSWIIFQWTATHVSHLGAAFLFIILPGMAACVGGAALFRLWRRDEVFSKDVGLMLSIVRRNLVIALLALVTLLGAIVLAVATAHVITD